MGKAKRWCWLFLVGLSAHAAEPLYGPVVTIMQENDLVVRTDRHYTQGLKFNFLGGEDSKDQVDRWPVRMAEWLPSLGASFTAARYGLSVGQSIYTPTDITIPTLQLNDRPYAGFLYGEMMLQRRGVVGNVPMLDHFQVDLGIIGPPSMGEHAQNTVHQLRHFGLAQGWGTQLTTEVGMALKYGRIWRVSLGELNGWETQFLPRAGVSLGNVGTYGVAGGEFRFGYHLPENFGLGTVDSIVPASGGIRTDRQDHPWGCYVFVGGEGRAVAYNEFLDGNLFHASHHVAKRHVVGEGRFGLVVAFRYFDLAYTQVIRSKEFVGQQETDAFGSIAIRFKW
jgi:lipid A 3-O-deacylase